MKMPMSWHMECFANKKESLKRKMEELQRVIDDVKRAKMDLEVYSFQIDRATRERRGGFDREKFGKKKP